MVERSHGLERAATFQRMLGRACAAMLTLLFAAPAIAATPSSPTSAEVTSAVLRCAEHIRWPAAVLPASSPIHVCILGEDAASADIAARLSSGRASGRSLVVRKGLEIKRPCNILYVPANQADRLLLVQSVLGDAPTLTIGEGPQFTLRGGMVGIVTSEGKTSLVLNRKAIERVQLSVAPGLSTEVPAVAGGADSTRTAAATASSRTDSTSAGGARARYTRTTHDNTYDQETLLQAAENFFGITTANLAQMVRKAFAEHGEPDGYIEGEEVSGAFLIGVRYGKGVLHRKRAKDVDLFWRGPSVGIDAGGNAAKVFVLVYNIKNTDQIYARFPGVDGSLYVVGGLGMNYQRADTVVLAPIRTGVGLRLGANIGYLHYSKDNSWIPF